MLLSVTVEGYMERRWEVHYCWDTCKVWMGQCQSYVERMYRAKRTHNVERMYRTKRTHKQQSWCYTTTITTKSCHMIKKKHILKVAVLQNLKLLGGKTHVVSSKYQYNQSGTLNLTIISFRLSSISLWLPYDANSFYIKLDEGCK